MIFHQDTRIGLRRCDPAGIGFCRRHFAMAGSVAARFFRKVAGLPFDLRMRRRAGVPAAVRARISDFMEAS